MGLAPAPAAAETPAAAARASVVSVLPVYAPGSFNVEQPEGSGVVVRDGRTVVTALHVIQGAVAIRVRSADGEIVEARRLASDVSTDLAVLEMETRLPPIEFGGDPEMGEPVCAIGNAFGLGLSISCGVVSAVHRSGVGFNRIEDFVQTDAAVNPGDSGGALVDEAGRLVGVLSAIFTKTSDANIGVNFAVSAPLTETVVTALVETGRFRPPPTGLRLSSYPPPGETGRMAALVERVFAASAGAAAGLRRGDLILRADARRIRSPDDMTAHIARRGTGDTIVLAVERDGERLTLDLAPSEPVETEETAE